MTDIVLTGASRGIGRALALALASPHRRLFLVARDRPALAEVARLIEERGGRAVVRVCDLADLDDALKTGTDLARDVEPGTLLIHNAGLWPSERVLTPAGYERSFVVNHLAPARLQEPLLATGKVARLLVVSAGLLVKGRFRDDETPSGQAFSSIRTYCDTKLCFALWSRAVAEDHPDVDVAVIHPGVVETGLGDRGGLLGILLRWVKARWEKPEACAERLLGIVERARWATPGQAAWFVEDADAGEAPWPENTEDPQQREALVAFTRRALSA